jgi:hypothetical protein
MSTVDLEANDSQHILTEFQQADVYAEVESDPSINAENQCPSEIEHDLKSGCKVASARSKSMKMAQTPRGDDELEKMPLPHMDS